jgi:hypothetical protein
MLVWSKLLNIGKHAHFCFVQWTHENYACSDYSDSSFCVAQEERGELVTMVVSLCSRSNVTAPLALACAIANMLIRATLKIGFLQYLGAISLRAAHTLAYSTLFN